MDQDLIKKRNSGHFKTMGYEESHPSDIQTLNNEDNLDPQLKDFENRLSFNDKKLLDKYLQRGSVRTLKRLDYGSFKQMTSEKTFSTATGTTTPSARGLLYKQK